MPRLLDSQPSLYEKLLPPFFERQVPEETKATCGSCTMCDAASAPALGATTLFRADTKCCTYHPKLPNYLVGGLLADPRPELAEGRHRIRAKIGRRTGITPQWVKAPAKYDLLYKNAKDAFGRARSLRCPYYVDAGGLCSIWAYREAVCSTFFCKHVGGADGRALWMSVKRYLSLAEIQLARWALLELYPDWILRQGDLPSAAPSALGPADLDDAADDDDPTLQAAIAERHRQEWGPWAGHEEDLYIGCHELVSGLSRADLARILGIDGEVHVAVLDRLHAAVVAPTLPERPRLNPDLTVKRLADGAVALAFHSEFDAIALPEAGWRLLEELRGDEPLATARERLRRDHGADFSDEIYVELHRHRILI
jgi:hypothetical protein